MAKQRERLRNMGSGGRDTIMMDPKIGYHLSLGRCAIALSQGAVSYYR